MPAVKVTASANGVNHSCGHLNTELQGHALKVCGQVLNIKNENWCLSWLLPRSGGQLLLQEPRNIAVQVREIEVKPHLFKTTGMYSDDKIQGFSLTDFNSQKCNAVHVSLDKVEQLFRNMLSQIILLIIEYSWEGMVPSSDLTMGSQCGSEQAV